MIPRMLIWVSVCFNNDCQCERVVYGFTPESLYIKTERIELDLEKRNPVFPVGKYLIMNQDTSYYAVQKSEETGVVLYIGHIKGGRKAAMSPEKKHIDSTLLVTTKFECFSHDKE